MNVSNKTVPDTIQDKNDSPQILTQFFLGLLLSRIKLVMLPQINLETFSANLC